MAEEIEQVLEKQGLDLPNKVIELAAEIYEDDPDKLADLLTKTVAAGDAAEAMIKVLTALTSNRSAFQRAAENILNDINLAEKQPSSRDVLKYTYENYLKDDNVLLSDGSIDINKLVESRPELPGTVQFSMVNALKKIPPVQRMQIIQSLENSSCQLLSESSIIVKKFLGTSGTVAVIALVAVQLAWEAYTNILRWWKGEISGKRCAANVTNAITATAAGVVGGFAGAAAGAYFGPTGIVASAVAVGIAGQQLANLLADWFTRRLFDLPKDEALENAYNFLGLHHTASNRDVNTRYRQLCLKYHPDKDSSEEAAKNWHKLQSCMAVIKVSQEQY